MVHRCVGLLAILCVACSDDGTVAAGGDSTGGMATAGVDASSGEGAAGSADPSETSGGPGETSGPPDPTDAGADTGSGSTGSPEASDPWQPVPGTSWQWQLSGEIDTSIDAEVYDIDLFDAPQGVIDTLHADGRVVICYFSAGSYEEWREDAAEFPVPAIGEPLDGWPGEAWLDHRDQGVRAIMRARLDLAVDKRCDAVEPDNVDGYANASGFDLSAEDQLDYNRFLATEAHARGLSIGLKNDVEQIEALVGDFDWALNEECVTYAECETNTPFVDAGKAVFHVEYVDDLADGPARAEAVCPETTALGLSSLIKDWELTAWREPCP